MRNIVGRPKKKCQNEHRAVGPLNHPPPWIGTANAPPPKKNVKDLSVWLKRWQVLQSEHLDNLATKVNHIVIETGRVFTVLEILVELTNGTSQQNFLLQEDIETLKGRLAVAAIFSSVYMIISTLCMTVYLVVFLKKYVKKHQLQRQEEEIELMDQKLQERRR